MQYDYYWRVEPSVQYHCDIDYDVFAFMESKDLKYGMVQTRFIYLLYLHATDYIFFLSGWTLSLTDYAATLETFWPTVVEWMKDHPEWMTQGNSSVIKWLHDDEKLEQYNYCHFWSNFEIGSLAFFRSEQYLSYFEHLDKSGGFFYERSVFFAHKMIVLHIINMNFRWGDAPVHSVAVALMVPEHQVHFFNDIGYTVRKKRALCLDGLRALNCLSSFGLARTFDALPSGTRIASQVPV